MHSTPYAIPYTGPCTVRTQYPLPVMTPDPLPLFGNSAADTATADPARNLLPYDGIVNDHGAVFAAEADVLLAWLLGAGRPEPAGT